MNGILVAVIGIPSIIATLATQFFWGGITTVMTGGLSYAIRTIDDYAIHDVLVGRIGVVPVQALWATAVAVALWFVLNRHRFGEHLLFIGDNVEVARVVGVNVGREKIKLFTLMGVLGAFAAVLLTAENKNFFNTQGSGFLLTVMAAVFIGGTSIFGGKATIVGSYVGAYIIGMIEAGLVATGMQGFWVRAVVGLVFLAAVVFHLSMDHDNVEVARVVGVNVGREKIKLFTLMGVLGAFAAVLLTAENKNFFNTQGSGFLLTVMAAVFIGGTSIFGGKATIVGSYVGAFIIGMIEAGLVATGMQGFWVRAVVGLVFLAAVMFHLSMDQPQRLARLKQLFRFGGKLERQPAPPAQGSP